MVHSFISIFFWLAAHTSSIQFTSRSLSAYPLALCNDGTPATYSFSVKKKADLENPYLLIYLKGGGACKSINECNKRCGKGTNPLCTANTRKKWNLEKDTMWSEDPEENPPFHNFLKVFVPYCSSDVYSGTRSAGEDTNGYYFHGKHIIEALVKDIIENKPNIENMKQLVFIGTSAGAMGVTVNCDYVAEQFHRVNKDLDVRCIADGGDFVPPLAHKKDCDPYEITKIPFKFWQGVGDQSCAGSKPGGGLDCLLFPSYYNDIETPYMVVNNYIDTVVKGPCTPPLKTNPEFWKKYQQEKYAMALKYIKDKTQNGLFLSNCPFHVSVNRQFAWDNMGVPLVNGNGSELYKNVVRNWLTGDGPYQAMDMPQKKNPKCPF